jgi:CRISPR-associated protein Cmr6
MAQSIGRLKKANIGWLFYKYYFKQQESVHNTQLPRQYDNISGINETIIKSPLRDVSENFDLKVNSKSICLKTTYPGLLIGSGYTHESIFENEEDKNEAFKIGFFFDHVTGMPYIPGHSIKGVLRSAFPNHKNEKFVDAKTESIISYLKEDVGVNTEESFLGYLQSKKIDGVAYTPKRFVTLLGNILFEGIEPCSFNFDETLPEKQHFKYVQISNSKRDIFHDAYLFDLSIGQPFLGTDYITPHKNPLKNPKPLKFLKILPEVKIQFQFDLKSGIIDAYQKEKLFQKILLDFGIGAKTNVGYGQLSEI